jgi:hypothetical protein
LRVFAMVSSRLKVFSNALTNSVKVPRVIVALVMAFCQNVAAQVAVVPSFMTERANAICLGFEL